ncbi:MAG: hypothetical protein IT425_08975 [Pirellulales bacterium]|nr:hypothetical protein [Pirellulales bacterium]
MFSYRTFIDSMSPELDTQYRWIEKINNRTFTKRLASCSGGTPEIATVPFPDEGGLAVADRLF